MELLHSCPLGKEAVTSTQGSAIIRAQEMSLYLWTWIPFWSSACFDPMEHWTYPCTDFWWLPQTIPWVHSVWMTAMDAKAFKHSEGPSLIALSVQKQQAASNSSQLPGSPMHGGNPLLLPIWSAARSQPPAKSTTTASPDVLLLSPTCSDLSDRWCKPHGLGCVLLLSTGMDLWAVLLVRYGLKLPTSLPSHKGSGQVLNTWLQMQIARSTPLHGWHASNTEPNRIQDDIEGLQFNDQDLSRCDFYQLDASYMQFPCRESERADSDWNMTQVLLAMGLNGEKKRGFTRASILSNNYLVVTLHMDLLWQKVNFSL